MSYLRFAPATLICLAALAASAPAGAQSAERRPTNSCAHYGPGFAPVGGGTCMKIGGRVRVEFGASRGGGLSDWRVAPEAGSASRGALPDYAPASDAPRHRLKPARNF
ncbi:MAG: porin [Methylobacteriaceae bacterium]|nr:porin [Methylobacteriaceae bacterium]